MILADPSADRQEEQAEPGRLPPSMNGFVLKTDAGYHFKIKTLEREN